MLPSNLIVKEPALKGLFKLLSYLHSPLLSIDLMGKRLFDLVFAFYSAYHSNPVNIFIHNLFIWPIFFSFLVLFHFAPLSFHLPIGDGLELKLGFVFALVYALFYVLMDRKGGSLAAILCYLCWVGGDWLASRIGFSLAWKVVLATQLSCWTFQFIVNGVFKKRALALHDDFF